MFIEIKDMLINLDNVINMGCGEHPYLKGVPAIWFNTIGWHGDGSIIIDFDSAVHRDAQWETIRMLIYRSRKVGA